MKLNILLILIIHSTFLIAPNISCGQVTDTLAFQDFETSPRTPVWTYSGSPTFNSGYTGTSASPANSPKGIGGSRAWETTAISAGVTLEFANITIPSGYDSIRVTFKLAAMNLSSTSGGPDNLDYVYLQYSTNGGTSYTHRMTIRGSTANNSTWAYSATGLAKLNYLPTTTTTFQPTTSGLQTTFGYSTCQIVFPGTVSQVRAKIIARSSSSSDTWLVDNVMITGDKSCLPNTGTDTVTTCNGYSSPSGRHFWTTSGTYLDTLQNSAGCDSILTVHLTVQSPPANLFVTACRTYTSPSGKYTWTQAGLYTDTIVRTAGCDSIMRINLYMLTTFFNSLRVNACDVYLSPAGHTYTSSAVFIDTLQSTSGCDSLIQVILTMGRTSASQITASACDSYTSPGGKIYTQSGVYTDSLTRKGCDSILTIQLNVHNSTSSAFKVLSCLQYTSPGGKVWTSSGIFTDTIPNHLGCDSVMNIEVDLGQPASTHQTDTACNRYVSVSGKILWASGVALDTMSTNHGCDSVVTTDVVVQTADTTITVVGNQLESGDPTGTYQWIDCENMVEIGGAVSRTFTVTNNGRFAVRISKDGCVVTAPCVYVQGLYIFEEQGNIVKVYPNPAGSFVYLVLEGISAFAEVSLYSSDGHRIEFRRITETSVPQRFNLPASQGLYFLQVNDDHQHHWVRIVRQ